MSHESQSGRPSIQRLASTEALGREKGIRIYVLLVLAMAVVTVTVTTTCLLLIRHRLRAQVTADLSQDLNQSVVGFSNLQMERREALDRETALLANLPTLKALMTSGDDLTVQDGAAEFWQLSGNDLFALLDPNGRVVAVYSRARKADLALRASLQRLFDSPEKHHLIDGKLLYACSIRPLYFGTDEDGSILGYVVSGISIERTVRQISEPTGVEATFISDGHIVASTLEPSVQASLVEPFHSFSAKFGSPADVNLGGTRYLAVAHDLSSIATAPLQLVVLKSTDVSDRWISRIDRIVLSTGVLALLFGTALMITLSRLLTRPLEELSRSVRAFGMGDKNHTVPRYGTQEVRQLSRSFESMRSEIQQANLALLESERLATIGIMASSVSHDLRHYLAAVYANAEFLASGRLSQAERAEIFGDIRAAVLGTTDMIESLLIFSRTGSSLRRSPEQMSALMERSLTLVRAHPDAEGVKLASRCGDLAATTTAFVDGKQIERAVYNLLLNACQAARLSGSGSVEVSLETYEKESVFSVIDNGNGVPESIRKSLFEPFVSEGKQKGTGLGLTLAHCIATEHGGEVVLLRSVPGETIFQMRVPRELRVEEAVPEVELKSESQEIARWRGMDTNTHPLV